MTDMKLISQFVEEGLAGLGVLDDADEIIRYCFLHNGIENAREAFERYNHAIDFVNEHGENDYTISNLSEEDFKYWTREITEHDKRIYF